MLPRGAVPLINMRHAGYKPTGSVWVNFGNFREPDWHLWQHSRFRPDLVVLPVDPVERLDFRCLVGLHVVLFLAAYNDAAALLFKRLQRYAASIDVVSPEFEEDIGWHWTRETGLRDFGTPARRVA